MLPIYCFRVGAASWGVANRISNGLVGIRMRQGADEGSNWYFDDPADKHLIYMSSACNTL